MHQIPENLPVSYRLAQDNDLVFFTINPQKPYPKTTLRQNRPCLEITRSGITLISNGSIEHALTPHKIHFRGIGSFRYKASPNYSSLLIFLGPSFITDFLQKFTTVSARPSRRFNTVFLSYEISSFAEANYQELIHHLNTPSHFLKGTTNLLVDLLLTQLILKDTSHELFDQLMFYDNLKTFDILEFMEKHLGEKITVSQLARRSNKSISTFKREFQSQFSITPHQWLLKRRLDFARNLLRNSHDPISIIAQTCGFENMSHFSKTYRIKLGKTPLEERKRSTVNFPKNIE